MNEVGGCRIPSTDETAGREQPPETEQHDHRYVDNGMVYPATTGHGAGPAVDPAVARAERRNMVHYWALRQHDLRDLQAGLSRFGLSSLGRSEPHVLATIRVVAALVAAVSAGGPPPEPMTAAERDPVLQRRAVDLLGPVPARNGPRIMVTLRRRQPMTRRWSGASSIGA